MVQLVLWTARIQTEDAGRRRYWSVVSLVLHTMQYGMKSTSLLPVTLILGKNGLSALLDLIPFPADVGRANSAADPDDQQDRAPSDTDAYSGINSWHRPPLSKACCLFWVKAAVATNELLDGETSAILCGAATALDVPPQGGSEWISRN